MSPYLTIRRFPYEEPHHLNLLLAASNGRFCGELEYYCNASDLESFGAKLENYEGKEKIEYSLGSESAEDRWAHFLKIEVVPVNSRGHCALCLTLANNFEPPNRERSEFCIESEVADINRFGRLMKEFSNLRHFTLDWRIQSGSLLDEDEE